MERIVDFQQRLGREWPQAITCGVNPITGNADMTSITVTWPTGVQVAYAATRNEAYAAMDRIGVVSYH